MVQLELIALPVPVPSLALLHNMSHGGIYVYNGVELHGDGTKVDTPTHKLVSANCKHVEFLENGDFEDSAYRGWNGPGWYFWDEADGQFCYGPYDSSTKAELMLEKYCKEVLGS